MAEFAWIRCGKSRVYHTARLCPRFPSQVRRLREDDLRRSVACCEWCRWEGPGDIDRQHYQTEVVA